MHMPKRNARQEYRLKQRELIEASPLMSRKFPQLKALKAMLEFFDPKGATKNGQMKCKVNVTQAKSALWFACPGVECLAGDFDLSETLAEAVAGGHKLVTGELRCRGTRKRGDRDREPCNTLLRYKLNLTYD